MTETKDIAERLFVETERLEAVVTGFVEWNVHVLYMLPDHDLFLRQHNFERAIMKVSWYNSSKALLGWSLQSLG